MPWQEEAAQLVQKSLFSMQTEFNKSPAGQALFKVIKEDYEPALARAKQTLTDTAKSYAGKTAPAYIATNATEIASKSRNIARQSSFGKNDSLIAHAINWANKTHGPVHAQNLADHVAMYMQDTVEEPISKFNPTTKKYEQQGTQEVSSIKKNIIRNKENKVPLNIKSVYQPQSELERKLQGYGNTILAPAIAIPHLGTVLNTAISTPLADLAKGLASVITPGGYQNTKKALLDTGIFADTTLNAYRDLQEFSSGKIAQMSGSPKLGYILGKATHQPGFDALRSWTLAFTGATAKHTAEDMAVKFVQTGSRRARIELEDMGLDLAKITNQKGVLKPDDIEKAVYNFVDRKVFLNTKLNRSYYANSNPIFRTTLMFHSYVAAQGRLLYHEFSKMYRTGDVAHIAQTLAVLGVAFPVAGTLISSLEEIARGQGEEAKTGDKLSNLMFQNGIEAGTMQYLDAYAHMAGFGVATSYVRGALRQHLSDLLVGPVGNVAVRGIQDAAHFGQGLYRATTGGELKGSDYKPLERDLLEDTLPDNIGKILSHKFIPSTKEEAERNPKQKKLQLKMKHLKAVN
jgi:hypothetical protein